MIIVRAPYRISLFGGGTDYKQHYLRHGGSVLGATIDKYCWISVRPPTKFGPKFKLVYSKVEECDVLEEIEHPAARECLRFMGFEDEGCEIHHWGDLPARSGMGSSSAFVVALLHALYVLSGRGEQLASELAKDAILIEQEVLGETVGDQDQWLIANGGLCRLDFRRDTRVTCRKLALPTVENGRAMVGASRLEGCLMLFYTGIQRTSSDVAKEYVQDFGKNEDILRSLKELAVYGEYCVKKGKMATLGQMMDRSWTLKKSLGGGITTPELDSLYTRAKEAGALGGKITGAGGGGFLLLFALPDKQALVREALKNLVEVPVKFDWEGSSVRYDDEE